MATTPFTDHFQLPFPRNTFGSRWGVVDRWHPTPHRGTDFAVPAGAPIPAVATGKVVRMYPLAESQWLGNVTVVATKLRRKFLGKNRILYVGYCHQSRFGHVKVGQRVNRGTTVGFVGDTGKAAFGDHLHLTFSYTLEGVFQGVTFDPIPLITAHDGS